MRGYGRCGYHADIFDETQAAVKQQPEGERIKLKCLGGGRISHEPDKKKLLVYGYSQVRSITVAPPNAHSSGLRAGRPPEGGRHPEGEVPALRDHLQQRRLLAVRRVLQETLGYCCV